MKVIHQGILLRKINYSESSLILRFYTLENGIQSYIFQGGKKKKGNFLQPLSIVEIEAYFRPDSELGKITSISPIVVFKSIPFNPLKSGMAFFIAEIIDSCLKSVDHEPPTYDFLKNEITWLDLSEEITNYSIWFLIRFSDYLGFVPKLSAPNPTFFDLEEGELTAHRPAGHTYIQDSSVAFIPLFLNQTKEELLALTIGKKDRSLLLTNCLTYYKYHIDGFKTPKSLAVLQTIFN